MIQKILTDVASIGCCFRYGTSAQKLDLWVIIGGCKINCVNIIHNVVRTKKYLQILAIIRLSVLLGISTYQWLFQKLHVEWHNHPQPPTHYWTFKKLVDQKWKKDARLIAINKTAASTLILPNNSKSYSLDYLMKNPKITSSTLSEACISMFEEDLTHKENCRKLDVLAYGNIIQNKSSEIEEELKAN